jgi:hypothetical protein
MSFGDDISEFLFVRVTVYIAVYVGIEFVSRLRSTSQLMWAHACCCSDSFHASLVHRDCRLSALQSNTYLRELLLSQYRLQILHSSPS